MVCTIGNIESGQLLPDLGIYEKHRLTVGNIPAEVISQPYTQEPCRIGTGEKINGEYERETAALPLPTD